MQKVACIWYNTNATLIFADADPLTMPVSTGNSPKKLSSASAKLIIKSNGRYMCGVCQKSYSTASNCYKHLQLHLGGTTCGVCNTVLASKNSLLSHVATKHLLGPFRCEFCNKTYASEILLERHKNLCQNVEIK